MMTKFSARDKADCAKREADYRRHVYARMVSAGLMKQALADRQLSIMEEIEADYRALAEAEELQERLL